MSGRDFSFVFIGGEPAFIHPESRTVHLSPYEKVPYGGIPDMLVGDIAIVELFNPETRNMHDPDFRLCLKFIGESDVEEALYNTLTMVEKFKDSQPLQSTIDDMWTVINGLLSRCDGIYSVVKARVDEKYADKDNTLKQAMAAVDASEHDVTDYDASVDQEISDRIKEHGGDGGGPRDATMGAIYKDSHERETHVKALATTREALEENLKRGGEVIRKSSDRLQSFMGLF